MKKGREAIRRDEVLKIPTLPITTGSNLETRPRNMLTINDEEGLLVRGKLSSQGTRKLR